MSIYLFGQKIEHLIHEPAGFNVFKNKHGDGLSERKYLGVESRYIINTNMPTIANDYSSHKGLYNYYPFSTPINFSLSNIKKHASNLAAMFIGQAEMNGQGMSLYCGMPEVFDNGINEKEERIIKYVDNSIVETFEIPPATGTNHRELFKLQKKMTQSFTDLGIQSQKYEIMLDSLGFK